MKTEEQPAAPSQAFTNTKEVEAHMKTRMDKAVADLQHEMASIRTGRATLSLLDNIRVDYYGTPTPLNQIGNLHVPEPAMITIQPWDISQIGAIEKAIRVSDLGLNPSNDGKIVRLPIPPLTQERRKDLVKKLHAAAEHHRVSVRNIRRDANDAVKKLLKDKKIAEDDEKRAHDEIQKLTDSFMAKIDQASKTKEKEIYRDLIVVKNLLCSAWMGAAICIAGALPLAAQPSANDIMAVSRAALGGPKLAAIQSITLWGPDRRGSSTTEMALSAEMAGKFLKEHTVLSSGGEVQRTSVGEDGAISVGGGMPGDEGGPAFTAVTTEGLNGETYWAKLSTGAVQGGAETVAATREQAFVRSFALYMLALTLSTPGNFPMTFAYAGQVESPGGMADGIEAKGPNGFVVHLFIDAKTHLPVMLNYLNGAQNVQMWLKDYRPEDGVLFPHTMTWIANGNLTEEFQAQRFKVNPKFGAGKFQR